MTEHDQQSDPTTIEVVQIDGTITNMPVSAFPDQFRETVEQLHRQNIQPVLQKFDAEYARMWTKEFGPALSVDGEHPTEAVKKLAERVADARQARDSIQQPLKRNLPRKRNLVHFPVLRTGIGLIAPLLWSVPCAVGQCPATWTRVELPDPRASAAAVFDEARGVVVLFGGELTMSQLSGETWEWDGAMWRLAATSGPPARRRHAMAYDSARHVTMLFGGLGATGALNDTWEWNGTSWREHQRQAISPSARSEHGMAYDPVRRRAVLYGGTLQSGDANGETWEWDGRLWTQAAAMGPSATHRAAMAFHAALGESLLIGGTTGLWSWNGLTWTERSGGGLPGFQPGSVAYDGERNRIVFANGNELFGTQVYEWNGMTWNLVFSGGPARRTGHVLVYDARGRRTLQLGGLDPTQSYLGDLWAYNGFGWTQLPGGNPGPRCGPSMAFDTRRGVALLFGGISEGNVTMGDTWEWIGRAWVRRSSTGPAPRSRAAISYDSDRGVIVLAGGETSAGGLLGDTWEWNGTAWRRAAAAGAPGNPTISMAYDDARHGHLLSQLYDPGPGPPQSFTWEWNGTNWTQRTTTAGGWSVVYDSRRSVVVGATGSAAWEWTGTGWTQRAATGLSFRPWNSLAYDVRRGRTIMFGGRDGNSNSVYPNDTWEYDGAEWDRRLTVGPPGRIFHAMTYDSQRGDTLLFGGWNSTCLGDTWIYRADSLAGDIDANCIVGRADSRIFVNALLGNPIDPAQLARADLNGDGVVDAEDIQAFTAIRLGP